ncbi:MAG: TetR family transcriptional regulator [Casimicrobiaceae bacterium]
MVGKTRAGAAATREALLDAAERKFRAKGVAHTTLADVARAANLTRGAVYWHFRDKAAMLAAMCERAALPLEAMIACCGANLKLAPLMILRNNAVQGLMRLARDTRTQAVFDVVFNHCESNDEHAPLYDRRRQNDEGCRQHVMGLLRRAIDEGELPADTDADMAAEIIRAFMLGVMHAWMQDPRAYDLERNALPMIDTLLAGLVARPPRIVARPLIQREARVAAAD